MYKRQAYKFNLYPYNDSISLFMYDYEGDDGTACAVSFYMRPVSYTHLSSCICGRPGSAAGASVH